MTGTTQSGTNIEIRCPECGGIEAFRYIEDIVNHRNVEGFNEHGVLRVSGRYETGEGYDDGTNPRLECRNNDQTGRFCGHEFPIPEGIEIDFV